MSNDEKKLYQKNIIGYNLILLFISLNTAYTIQMLKSMKVDYYIGIFIITTIVLSLISFLAAVKVRIYSQLWGYLSVGLGIFQISRFLLNSDKFVGINVLMNIILISSALCAIIGGVTSIVRAKKRTSYINKYGISKDFLNT